MPSHSDSLKRAVLLVKDVPAGTGPIPLESDGTVNRRAVSTMSGVDIFAAAAAKDRAQEVIAVTMGPSAARGTLHEALCLGADRAIQITDPALKGVDAPTTAHVLASAIRNLSPEAVFLGRESSDGRLGLLPGMLAELLGWNLITAADQIGLTEKGVIARVREDRATTAVTVQLPAVISVAEYGSAPRPIEHEAIRHAFTRTIENWSLERLTAPAAWPGHQVQNIDERLPLRKQQTSTGDPIETIKKELQLVKGRL